VNTVCGLGYESKSVRKLAFVKFDRIRLLIEKELSIAITPII
jgi:hypothetical protein